MSDTPAPRLGPYRLLSALPGGGQGQVWAALGPSGQELVLKRHGTGQDEAGGLAEAALLGLSHPGLAACLDVGRSLDDGRLYTVTARIVGEPMGPGSLASVPGDQTLRACAQLLGALGALHDLGLLHRDLKPDNVLLQAVDGRPVVLDFGLCCGRNDVQRQPLAGTPRAMAPELFSGASASVATDLWAAGLVLAEALLGRELVSTGNAAAMAAEREALVLPTEELARHTGRADLARLLSRLMDPDPARRPADVPTALAELSELGHAAYREALDARRVAALALEDPRRAARLSALAEGAVCIDLDVDPGLACAGAWQALAAAAQEISSSDERVRAGLAAEQRRPAEVRALAAALAERMPMQLVLCSSDGAEPQLRAERQRLLQQLEGVQGATLVDPAPPGASGSLRVLQAWLGAAPELQERLQSTPPASWRELDEATAELSRLGVVRPGPLGHQIDETVLPASWPLATALPLPALSAPAALALDLICLSAPALGAAELQVLAGEQAAAALDELVGLGLLRRDEGGQGALYRPADERLRRGRADLAQVPGQLRGALALRLAGSGEPPPDEVLAAQVAQLLGTDSDGPDQPALSALALTCAGVLRRVGRLELSGALLRRALGGCPERGPLRRSMQLELIDVLLRGGQHEPAAEALIQAEAELPSDPSLAMRRGRSLALRGRFAEAQDALAALDPDQLTGDDAVLGLQVRGGVLHALGRNEAALLDLREALRRQGEAPHRRTMTLLERLGLLERELGRFDRAIRFFERAQLMARQLGHDALVWSPLYNIGRVIRDRGDSRRGLAIQSEAAQLCEETGNRIGLTTVLNSMGAGWLTLGRTDRARRHLRRALELARELGNPASEAMVLNNLGEALAAEGRYDEAAQSWEDSLALRDGLGDARGRAAVRLTRAPVRLFRGEAQAAREDLAAASADLSGLEAPQWQVAAELLAARLALHDERLDEALRASAAALQRAQDHDLAPQALRARALLAQAGGDDLSDFDPDAGEAGPWTAEALVARASLHGLAERLDSAHADLDRAASILADSPDERLELSLLAARLEFDLDSLQQQLGQDEPDVGRVGALLSDVSRDLDRARALAQVHSPQAGTQRFDALASRLDAMDRNADAAGLSSLAGRMRDLERLAEITKRLSAERDTQQLLDLIIDAAIELTGAARGFLILFDGKAEEFRAARNIDEGTIANPEFEVSHSVARDVVRSGVPLLTANAVDDPRLTSAASISELKLLSILCVPIAWRGRVHGAVYLDHPQVVSRFSEGHQETVSRLAEQAAIALENARLQQGLQRSNAELEARRAEVARLNDALQQRLQKREAELELARESLDATQRALELRYDYSNIVTRSPAMHQVFDLLDRITDTHFPVMILGESGTGKELLARAIHFNGPRHDKNFLTINCAAIAEPLIESELFGSMKGAFSGADRDRKGLFAQAHEGTLFLDEIGDMSLGVQQRLLRVLQQGEFLPVGGRELVKVDVRILCATHRRLEQRVKEGSFREDLYYRLVVARVELPALRERSEDLALLLPHFLEQHGGSPRSVDPEALALLEARPWPGNVREFENFVMNLVLFDRDGGRLTPELVSRLLGPGREAALPGPHVAAGATQGGSGAGPLKARMEAFERLAVQSAMQAAGGNKAAAARALGVTARTLYKMLERLGI